ARQAASSRICCSSGCLLRGDRPLSRADGTGSLDRFVQRRSGKNELLQAFLVDNVALAEIDGAPDVAFEARIEEARRVLKRGAPGEGQLHLVLVRLAGADDSLVRPHR